jgi:hypothetical protein
MFETLHNRRCRRGRAVRVNEKWELPMVTGFEAFAGTIFAVALVVICFSRAAR